MFQQRQHTETLMPTRRLFAVSAALAALLSTGVATMAHAAFPDRPIRLVVGYPPGGGTDVIARLFATQLTEKLKQPVVIENRAGAAGMIGSEFVANAPADGYTMIFTASDTHTINPHVYPKIRYDARRDFTPVGLAGFLTMALVTNNSQPGNLKDFIAAARAKPGSFNFASWGIGSSSQVAMEAFLAASGMKMTHVPFQGAAPALTAVLASQVEAFMVPMTLAEPNFRAGKLKLIGVAAPQRVPWAKDIPTLAEQGIDSDGSIWLGVLAPAKAPAEAINAVNKALNDVIADPAVSANLYKNGFIARGGSVQDFNTYLQREFERMGKVIRDAGIKAD
ncbi:MAG: tripartite tricarboxylate transporter substrate binding protein [Betaproteobacteria bacterium]|nr:tripartite tricarboxylate transporter substrate binding protein [Betaproteobacteria bacterium]